MRSTTNALFAALLATRLLVALLLAVSLVMLMVQLSVLLGLGDVAGQSVTISDAAVSCLSNGCRLCTSLLLLRFVTTVRKGPAGIFSPEQSRRFLAMSALTAANLALGLYIPSAAEKGVVSNGLLSYAVAGGKLDLTDLLLAIVFFVLWRVFDYGCKLQEDSDSIL